MSAKIFILFLILLTALAAGCHRPQPVETAQASVVLEEGTTQPNPDYFVSPTGEVIYNENPTGEEANHDESLPPVFAGAQRIYPSDENPALRESYMTRAPLDAIVEYYTNYLDIRLDRDFMRTHTFAEDVAVVQSIALRDEEGRRQIAMFVNEDEGPRGGLKVMLKEFPNQHAVQIILTTLDATPPGMNPVGLYVTADEVEEWAAQEAARQEEERKRREESARQAEEQGQGSAGN